MAKSLDQTAEQLGNILLSSGLHLTTAESCTAGLVSMTLAAVESSGDFYTSGFVTYSENAKIRLLGVHPDTLKQHTAVSEQTAREMVQGACARSGEPVGLSITGYAGPDGGEDGALAVGVLGDGLDHQVGRRERLRQVERWTEAGQRLFGLQGLEVTLAGEKRQRALDLLHSVFEPGRAAPGQGDREPLVGE